MPIKALETSTRRTGISRIGKLRKGAPKGENQPGKELPYFRFVADNEDATLQAEFDKLYGKQPVEIPVFLPYPQPMDNLQYWCEIRNGTQLVHRCDGDTVYLRLGNRNGKPVMEQGEWPCNNRDHIRKYNEEGDPMKDKVGHLTVVLAQKSGERYIPAFGNIGVQGVVWVETHGFYDINNWLGTLEKLQCTYELDPNGQPLYPIPFVLKRVKRKVNYTDKDNQRRSIDKVMVELDAAREYRRDQFAMLWGGADAAPAIGPGRVASVALPASERPALPARTPPPTVDVDTTDEDDDYEPPPFGDIPAPVELTPDEIGKRLWPGGVWEKVVKPAYLKEKLDPAGMVARRLGELTGADWEASLGAHINRAWPTMAPPAQMFILGKVADGWNRPTADELYSLFAAINTVAESIKAGEQVSDEAAVARLEMLTA